MENSNLPPGHEKPHPESVIRALMETFVCSPDLATPSSVSQISLALEQALLRQSDEEKVHLLERSVLFGSYLQEAANRLRRQHDTFCNTCVWPLTFDLTIKVFSLLGVHSLCQAAASCTLFRKAAMEPACYRDIDLTDLNLRVDNNMVAKVIARAGQHLRLLKLGVPALQSKGVKSPRACIFNDPWLSVVGKIYLTKSCLDPLLASGGAAGALLQTLHLENIAELDSRRICKVLAVCPGLLDLEIIGLQVNVRKVLRSVTCHCHKLTHLCIQSPNTDLANSWLSYSMKMLSCSEIVHGCPNISSLSLRGFKLPDQKVKLLMRGLRHLSEVDFSGADLLTGSFLRDLVLLEDQKIRSLKLCDCISLKAATDFDLFPFFHVHFAEPFILLMQLMTPHTHTRTYGEVNRLLSSLITGECRTLRHLDVSNKDGLVSSNWTFPRSNLNEDILISVRKERPEVDLRADFSDEKSSSGCDSMSLTSSFDNSEYNEPMEASYHSENFLSEDSHSLQSSTSNDSGPDTDDGEGDYDDDNDDDEYGNAAAAAAAADGGLNGDYGNEDEDAQFLSPCYSSEGDELLIRCPFTL